MYARLRIHGLFCLIAATALLHEPAGASGLDGGSATTALHTAVRHGNAGEVRRALDAGVALDATDDARMSALHYAAVAGQLEIAALLLDRGADPNVRGPGDMTTLHFAAMLGQAEMAGLLLRRGARADLFNASGLLPIHLAAGAKVVDVLAAAGADVNALTSKGATPLHTARHGLVAKALVDHKADLRIRNPKGRTAMEIAGIETLEPVGLSIHSLMLGRLRGIIGQMPLTLTNVSAQPLRALSVTAHSPACSVDVTPAAVAEVLPGQNADLVLTFTRNPTVREGEYPIFLTINGNGKQLGVTDLKVDTSTKVTPEDQGMIRLAKGTIRPASSRWYYVVYACAPLLVIAAWWFLRRR